MLIPVLFQEIDDGRGSIANLVGMLLKYDQWQLLLQYLFHTLECRKFMPLNVYLDKTNVLFCYLRHIVQSYQSELDDLVSWIVKSRIRSNCARPHVSTGANSIESLRFTRCAKVENLDTGILARVNR